MAPKRPSPLRDPPVPASSSQEDVESTEDDEGSSSEEEEQEAPPLQPSPFSKKSVSSDESESESDSDVEPAGAVDSSVKPLASKPMEDSSDVKKVKSKPLGTASPGGKRAIESEGDDKDSKRAKKKSPEAEGEVVGVEKSVDDGKKQLFQRLWSEDDEIEILKGMIEYSAKKGADPAADMNAFHEFIKKSVHVDVSKTQLVDKIRRLKKKYENNVGKGKKGEDRSFSKPHEQKAFELSKKVWGKDGISAGSPNAKQDKSNGKAKENQIGSRIIASVKTGLFSSPDGPKKEVEKLEPAGSSSPSLSLAEMIRFDKNLGMVGLEEDFLKQGLQLIDEPKKAELEEKWKKLHVAELEIFLKRTELIKEQTKLVLEACKSSDS